MTWLLITILILTVFTAIEVFFGKGKKTRKFFDDAGIRYLRPHPLYGNVQDFIFKRKHLGKILKDIYNAFPSEKYAGFYEMLAPWIVVRDPKVAKMLLQDEFSKFSSRSNNMPEDIEPFLGKTLLFLKGENWEKMRLTMASTLKTKNAITMCPMIMARTEKLLQQLENLTKEKEDFIFETDCNHILKPYFVDVFASLAFGQDLDVYNDAKNKFFGRVSQIDFSHTMYIQYLVATVIIPFFRITGIRYLSRTISQYFKRVMQSYLEHRKNSDSINHDFIHFFLQQKHDWDINYMTSQAIILLLSGSDTLASTLGFIMYELAMQPAIQRKLKEEIDQTVEEFGQNPPTKVIHSMEYMNMVFLETLRKWPQTSAALERVCQEDFILPPPRENAAPVKITKGIGVMISVYGIHRDADYWEDPETFDPERFNEANIKNIKPFTYIPFGIGPRSCVGKKLGTRALKLTLFHLMKRFEFVKIAQTKEKLQYDCEYMTLRPGNNWIGFKLRT